MFVTEKIGLHLVIQCVQTSSEEGIIRVTCGAVKISSGWLVLMSVEEMNKVLSRQHKSFVCCWVAWA